jgi:DNA-binding response OmpR family regulator
MTNETAGRILIIDDEANVRRLLSRVLQRAGFIVEGVAGGAEALRLLSEKQFHLVYLDIRMPDMSGLDVLKEIRLSWPDLPVTLLTAHASLQTALDAIRLGAKDYLVKPIDPEVFVAQTRMILQEQIIEQRKRELRQQIAALQDELYQLQQKQEAPTELRSEGRLDDAERFLKRGHLILDMRAQRAILGDRVLDLPPTPFKYLSVLAQHAPDVVSYQTLVSEAQGYAMVPNEASELAKYHIHVLRQTLHDIDPQKEGIIDNVRGVGYRLETQTQPGSAS